MDLSKIYSPRPDWVHKGNYGSVLVVCGSKLYPGSATLAAVAALRSGADLVTVVAPQRAADFASHHQIDLITYPLRGDFLAPRHVNDILDILKLRKINAIVIGCGLGRREATVKAIEKLIQKFTLPLVIDADGLFAISKKPSLIHNKHAILTPHWQELQVLLGKDLDANVKVQPQNSNFDLKLIAAKEAAQKYQSVVLLKGHVDIITDGATTITNNSGSVYMTKGGFGDTLSGIVGALLARGVGIFEAALAAAYINGKAGELAADKLGEGVAASDIFEYIPKVISVNHEV